MEEGKKRRFFLEAIKSILSSISWVIKVVLRCRRMKWPAPVVNNHQGIIWSNHDWFGPSALWIRAQWASPYSWSIQFNMDFQLNVERESTLYFQSFGSSTRTVYFGRKPSTMTKDCSIKTTGIKAFSRKTAFESGNVGNLRPRTQTHLIFGNLTWFCVWNHVKMIPWFHPGNTCYVNLVYLASGLIEELTS